MIAQRPGFTAPTLLARQFATLDQLPAAASRCTSSPAAMHRAAAGRQHARRQGRALRADQRVPRHRARRMDQRKAVRLQRQVLQGRERLFAGEAACSTTASNFVGGGSDAAIEVAGKHADTFALWGESYAQVRDVTSRVHNAAARHGRPTPRFSLSVRPILADTEEKAWAKADEILARATALQDKTGYRKPADGMPPPARGACCRSPTRAPASTSGCGPRSPNSPAPTATRRRWSVRPSRSPKCSAIITTSASATS